jgi:cellobiose phosphorylase
MVDPVIPKAWPGFKASRVFRGVRYEIEVRRATKNEAPGLIVDGAPVAGNVIPLAADHVEEVAVEVIIAK